MNYKLAPPLRAFPSSPGSIRTSNGWPLSPGLLAPARAPDSPYTHPALHGPRLCMLPARLHTTPPTRTLYTTLPKRFTPRPGLAHPHVTAITSRSTHVPSDRAGPLGRTRLGRPGPTPAGPDAPHGPAPWGSAGPTTLPPRGSSRRVCHSLANCRRASKASSRCRHVRPVGLFDWGPRIGPKGDAYLGYGKPLADPAHRLHPRPEAYHGNPRATQRDETAQVGRVYPNHPAALRSGMQMGFDSPEQQTLPFGVNMWRGRKFE